MTENSDNSSRIFEIILSPVIAILFWFTMVVIVVMSLAHGKVFEANIFEAFGAIGQVVIAAALLWLGWQQFTFTKLLGERERRLDMHDRRAKMITEYAAWSTKYLLPLNPETDVSSLLSIALRSKALFSRAVVEDLGSIVEEYANAEELRTSVEQLKNMNDLMSFMEMDKRYRGVRQHMRAVDERVRVRMLFEIDAAPDAAPQDLVFSDPDNTQPAEAATGQR